MPAAGGTARANPNVELDWPTLCAVAGNVALPVLAWIVEEIVEEIALASAEAMVQQQVDQVLAAQNCIVSCASLIESFEHVPGELRIKLDFSGFDRVQLDLHYGALRMNEPVNDRGLALSPGSAPIVVTSGLGRLCATDNHGAAPACQSVPAGANGMFNQSFNVPLLCSPGETAPCYLVDSSLPYNGLYGPRLEVYGSVNTVSRDPDLLPVAEAQAGTLLARVGGASSSPSPMIVGGARLLSVGSTVQSYLQLGMNDHRNQPIASGGFQTGWAPDPGREYGSGVLGVSIVFFR
jgi:hypothetical protein